MMVRSTPQSTSASTPQSTSTSTSTEPSYRSDSSCYSQEALQLVIRAEIGDQTWQFDAVDVARMLSPKTPKPGLDENQLRDLANYDCKVDEPLFDTALHNATRLLDAIYKDVDGLARTEKGKVTEWPSTDDERVHYPPLATFLNSCVSVSREALGNSISQDAWYKNLQFIPFDRPCQDGVEGASPLKPDVAGGEDLLDIQNSLGSEDIKLFWSPSDPDSHQLRLPVKVKDDWPDMVAQAGTYSRCLFSASPSRRFALVLAFGHSKRVLRFLIFHRGGLTACRELYITRKGVRKEVLRLFMSILLWSTPEDAGLLSSCNDFEVMIPRYPDDREGMLATVKEVVHDSLCDRGRATRVCRLSCKGKAGQTVQTPNAPPPSQAAGLDIVKTSPTSKTRKGDAKGGSQLAPSQGKAYKADKSSKDDDKENIPIFPHTRNKHPLKYVPPAAVVFSSLALQNLKDDAYLETILKSSWQGDDRKVVERDMYTAAGGHFGTPSHICSYEGRQQSGEPISNCLFLPHKDRLEHHHWKLLSETTPSAAEIRTLCYSIFQLVGHSLITATSSWELCLALVHAMLGWLAFYQAGYMHRDISIGNILLLREAVEMPKFEISNDLLDLLASKMENLNLDSASDPAGDSPENTKSSDATELEGLIKRLLALLEDLKVGTSCKGFATDGDMAAVLKEYFNDSPHGSSRFGTVEFMSESLQKAMNHKEDYLHSPVDDLHSFYWVAQWAVLFNNHNKSHRSPKEHKWQQYISDGQVEHKMSVASDIKQVYPKSGHSPITMEWAVLLKEWHASLEKLNTDWLEVRFSDEVTSGAATPEYFEKKFHIFAFRGLVDFMEVVQRHAVKLQSYNNFDTK